jgi:hypothetical protein
MADHITRYDLMPIPPVEKQTRWFDAGQLRIGVEYRLLTDAIASASVIEKASGSVSADSQSFDDRGVSLHVCLEDGGEFLERLRFDCFDEDPHYHYVSWEERANEVLHLDPIADGDPLHWALERIRTRLAPMLARAGVKDAAARVDPVSLEEALPRITEAAFAARFNADEASVLEDALEKVQHGRGR